MFSLAVFGCWALGLGFALRILGSQAPVLVKYPAADRKASSLT